MEGMASISLAAYFSSRISRSYRAARSIGGRDECFLSTARASDSCISGGIAGALIPSDWDDVCVDCDLIEYEGCCDDMQLENTAAYGTIKITYDTATAKKVAVAIDGDDPTEFYKIPAAVVDDVVVNEVVIEE